MEWIRANGGYPDMLGSDLWNQHPCCSAHNWRFKVAGFMVSFWISGCLVGTISFLCIPNPKSMRSSAIAIWIAIIFQRTQFHAGFWDSSPHQTGKLQYNVRHELCTTTPCCKVLDPRVPADSTMVIETGSRSIEFAKQCCQERQVPFPDQILISVSWHYFAYCVPVFQCLSPRTTLLWTNVLF